MSGLAGAFPTRFDRARFLYVCPDVRFWHLSDVY